MPLKILCCYILDILYSKLILETHGPTVAPAMSHVSSSVLNHQMKFQSRPVAVDVKAVFPGTT